MSPWIRTSDIPVSSDSTRLKEVCSLDAVSLIYILQKYLNFKFYFKFFILRTFDFFYFYEDIIYQLWNFAWISKLDILYKLKLKDSRKI